MDRLTPWRVSQQAMQQPTVAPVNQNTTIPDAVHKQPQMPAAAVFSTPTKVTTPQASSTWVKKVYDIPEIRWQAARGRDIADPLVVMFAQAADFPITEDDVVGLYEYVKQEHPDIVDKQSRIEKALEYIPTLKQMKQEDGTIPSDSWTYWSNIQTDMGKSATDYQQSVDSVPLQWWVRRWSASQGTLEWTALEWLEPVNDFIDQRNIIGKFAEIVDDTVQKIPTISRQNMAKALKWTPFEGMEVLPTIAANTPWSLLKTASSIARWLTNPFDAIIWLSKLVLTPEWRQAVVDRYWSIEGLKKTITEDPVWVASDALTLIQGWTNIAWRAAKLAWSTETAANLSRISKTAWNVADLGMSNALQQWVSAVEKGVARLAQWWWAQKAAGTLVQSTIDAIQPGKAAMRSLQWTVDNILQRVRETKTWLTDAEIKGIQSNPYQWEYWDTARKTIEEWWVPPNLQQLTLQPNEELARKLKWAIASYEEAHSDSWPLYNEIRKLNTKVDLSSAKDAIVSSLRDKYQVEVDTNISPKVKKEHPNWLLKFENSVFQGDTAMQSQIQSAFDIATSSREVDPTWFLNKRQAIDLKAKWEWRSTKASPVVKMMRAEIDKAGKEAIPGLDELDTLWSKQKKELDEMKSKLVYESWPKRGQYRDNITQIIKTLNKENRHQMLKRLEEIMPWIKERVDAIQNLPRLAKAYTELGKIGEWAKVGWAIWWAALWYMWWPVQWVISWILWYGLTRLLESKFWKLRQWAVDAVIKEMWPEAQAKLIDIEEKIQGRESLKAEDVKVIQEVIRKIQQAWENWSKAREEANK